MSIPADDGPRRNPNVGFVAWLPMVLSVAALFVLPFAIVFTGIAALGGERGLGVVGSSLFAASAVLIATAVVTVVFAVARGSRVTLWALVPICIGLLPLGLVLVE